MSIVNFPFNSNRGNPYAQATIEIECADGTWQAFQMEIDSGADITSFPASAGKVLGIDITKGQVIQMSGVDGKPFNVYINNLTIRLQGQQTPLPFQVPIAFAEIEDFDTLLGRQGLWGQFRSIMFDQVGQQTVFTLA